jgi:hypothetical protein
MKILGCWYSNNEISSQIIQSSLQSIKKASDSYKNVNIVTCNWSHVENNPFEEHITLCKMAIHLGIILQINRIFYEEEKKGNSYDAVCLLEHDVLYPEDYFNRVKDGFKSNPLTVINLDYIGMNQTGWLDVIQRHEPMHQFSFQYQTAIKHFDSLIKEAVMNGNVCLENSKLNLSVVKIPFKGEKPSCHINHSRNFTSHFNCYAKNSNGKVNHQYWGNFRQYYPSNEKSMQSTTPSLKA